MKQLYLLLVLLLSSVSGFAQADKDSLLKADYDEVLEKVTLMHYLDQKAMQLLTMEPEKKVLLNKDFKAFYTDSIIAGNPTKLDIAGYLGYRKEKCPKNADMFFEKVFNMNAKTLLKLLKTYGYLSPGRVKLQVGSGGLFHPIQLTLRTDEFDYEFNRLFEKEYKKGNMPEGDYALFLTMKKGTVTDSDIKTLESLGVRQKQ